ncbi:DUF3806 domain-containing protein [Cellulomonas sp. URHD0024]|uniref:DUF3806 domain-containing protein n=1 Tax=Cellulomonas sp. URHD0024 TaxID=1302620 RepID=UPI000411BD59|nr:DUF3806 domain-containing protein [Cellulomonas sp. URHD0024]
MGLFRRTARPEDGLEVPHPHAPADDSRDVRVVPLNAAEVVWAAQHREIVADLCRGSADAQTVSDLFDRVQAIWLQSDDRADSAPLVHAFGVALGDLVAERVPGLSWATAHGHGEPELVLSHPTHDLVIFPIGSVGEHWGHAPVGWLAGHVHEAVGGALAILAGHRSTH